MIPFSSRTSKFRGIYNNKTANNKVCDTIKFGYVLGHEKAFLIQNMCPITPKYILNKYVDKNSAQPVRVDGVFEAELTASAKKVLALQRKGKNLIFPDVLKIEAQLLQMQQLNYINHTDHTK